MKSMSFIPVLILLAAVLMLSGCGGAPQPAQQSSLALKPAVPIVKEDEAATLTDVETAVVTELTIPPSARAAAIQVEELKTLRSTMTMCTVNIQPPAPPSLDMSLRLKSVQALKLTGTPLYLRGRIMRDNEVMQTFSRVIDSGDQLIASSASPVNQPIVLDAFAGLNPLPPSMLFHVEIEFSFLPKGIEAASFDLSTPLPPDTPTGHIMSNPMRINILEGTAQ